MERKRAEPLRGDSPLGSYPYGKAAAHYTGDLMLSTVFIELLLLNENVRSTHDRSDGLNVHERRANLVLMNKTHFKFSGQEFTE
jgi:hypothetical protein